MSAKNNDNHNRFRSQQSNLINLLIKQLKTVKNKDFKYLGSGVQTYSWTV